MEAEAWYIAELAPGATSTISERVPWVRADRQVAWSSPPRKDETAVEYALRHSGFGFYLPRMRKEIVHHRTHKQIVRTFPLFTGYIFVGTLQKAPRFRDMLDAKGIARLLGFDGRPFSIDPSTVVRFMEAENAMAFDDTREARIRRRQEGRTQIDTIRMQFPVGSLQRITEGAFAGFNGQVESVVGKGIVKVMVDIFGRLTPIDTPVEYLRQVA